jgi:serine/threonine protein kinase
VSSPLDAAERSALGTFDSDDWMRRAARAAEAVALGEIAGYRIVRVVQRGAQGTVYEAVEPRSDRRVAIKRLPSLHDSAGDHGLSLIHI